MLSTFEVSMLPPKKTIGMVEVLARAAVRAGVSTATITSTFLSIIAWASGSSLALSLGPAWKS